MATYLPLHLLAVEECATRHPLSIAFRIPELNSCTGEVRAWSSITYAKFKKDIEHIAAYWGFKLGKDGIELGSVIGVSLPGIQYSDIVHVFGLSRAGFVPHLISVHLTSTVVIFELLQESSAKALICSSSRFQSFDSSPVLPIFAAPLTCKVPSCDAIIPPLRACGLLGRPVIVACTSGSTSDRPKVIPCSASWHAAIFEKAHKTGSIFEGRASTVSLTGSIMHIAQFNCCAFIFKSGACLALPSKPGFLTKELVQLTNHCGLDRLWIFASFLSSHIREAQRNPVVASILRSMKDIMVGGLTLSDLDMAWLVQNGIAFRIWFGCTECGPLMQGCSDEKELLQVIPGVAHEFRSLYSTEGESQLDIRDSLVELVILSSSPDCPDKSRRLDSPDGHFHTGDLFTEVQPGKYLCCGRDDDWIKMECSLRCDTRSIESNVYTMCSQDVSTCVVVGSHRPCPVLFLEPSKETSLTSDDLRRKVFELTREFHTRRYVHERIDTPEMIVVVEPGSLPRNVIKGNTRRKATEQKYAAELDKIFGT